MSGKELLFFRFVFIAASTWNLTGAIFGYFNPGYTFMNLFGRELTDPLFYSIYKGAWGTTFLYFFGYLFVSYNPEKHTGIVILGVIGKIGYVISLYKLFSDGLANSNVVIIIVGDMIFAMIFLYYFYRLIRLKIRIL